MPPPRIPILQCLRHPAPKSPSLRRRISTTPLLRKAPRLQRTTSPLNAQIEAAKLRMKKQSKAGPPIIGFYEQDADRKAAPVKVGSIETPEDLRRYQAEADRLGSLDIEDDNTRTDLFSDLIKDPDLADAKLELRSMRMDMVGDGKWGKEEKELDLIRKRQVIADLLEDPEMEDQHDELRRILRELPNMEVENEEFGEEQLREEMQELDALGEGPLVEGMSDEQLVAQLQAIGKDLDDPALKKEFAQHEDEHDEEAAAMLRELREYEKSKGFKAKAGEEEAENPREHSQLVQLSSPQSASIASAATTASAIEPPLSSREENPISTDPNAIITIEERITLAQRDPEHRTALNRLALKPESDPAIKHLNAVLRSAYMGANEDVRKALWRAYSRAKRVPGFLKMIPEDAWDMLWYSQAVKWKGNENRDEHMVILRRDLESIGMDGPPTPEQMLE
ncbi:hypothetical protein BU16DRAFT_523629 [Lophium mytilinum]|uniref:Uncharacterized protein n=1 Tax=Lophium mytilinum TaxID=390894 RepID=A0A6A6R6B2_9PEZI|nr:hypothetical protein BU16DRAFT_523629 [Lophium mytilinum]